MLKGSILQKLDTAHKNGKRPLNLGVYYKNTLVALCHALEDFILESESAPLMVTAFQRGKWYLQEAERYGDLAEKADQIVIMASPDTGFDEHPTSQRSNVEIVSLKPEDPVAQEWHLIIFSPTYTAMVLCQELSEADYGSSGQPSNDLERKFYGFWTFEPELVKETIEIAVAHIVEYNGELAQRLTAQLESMSAQFEHQGQDYLGDVVSCVVDYLETSHQHLFEPEEESYLPHSQALDNNLVSNEIQAFLRMAQLIDQADVNNPRAAAEVAALTETMAQLLDLPAWQQKRLRLASILHRLVPSLGSAVAAPAPEDENAAPYCELRAGVQALRARPRMRAIAEMITHQTERWDGTGVPGRLAFDDIPLESRILGLIAYFQSRVNDIRTHESETPPSREEALSQALSECQAEAGTAFDPKLVDALGLLVMGMKQGMSIEATQPKIAAGMWLLNAEEAKVGQTVSQ